MLASTPRYSPKPEQTPAITLPSRVRSSRRGFAPSFIDVFLSGTGPGSLLRSGPVFALSSPFMFRECLLRGESDIRLHPRSNPEAIPEIRRGDAARIPEPGPEYADDAA